MTTLHDAARQALEALESCQDGDYTTGDVQQSFDEQAVNAAIVALWAALAQQAEPVEPVAWLYTGIKQDGTEHGPHFVWKPEYMDAMSASKGAKATPLYFAPPQRKPLSEGALMGVYIDFDRTADTAWSGVEYLLRLCRAVERAHGITDPQVADRLARHGIPMPGDPK